MANLSKAKVGDLLVIPRLNHIEIVRVARVLKQYLEDDHNRKWTISDGYNRPYNPGWSGNVVARWIDTETLEGRQELDEIRRKQGLDRKASRLNNDVRDWRKQTPEVIETVFALLFPEG